MGKYASLETDIYSIFDLPAWQAENLKIYPANFVGINTGDTFIRLSIIPSSTGVNRASVSGILLLDIFVPSNVGTKTHFSIADKLDTYLASKTISHSTGTATQFGSSTVSAGKADSDNPSLYRTTYTIPFSYFEVL